ncbi:MAG: Fe-S-containing protein [Syntrophales bacterium]
MKRSGQASGSYRGVGALLLAIVLGGVLGVAAPGVAKGQAPASGNGEVAYPVSMFDNGKARHFDHKSADGVTIRYFVIKSSDGVIRAAFDACDVCWREGKGYVQKDDTMLCRNCGRRFPSARINVVSGGCNPAPLARTTESGKVVIKVTHILEGKRYFTFGGGRS